MGIFCHTSQQKPNFLPFICEKQCFYVLVQEALVHVLLVWGNRHPKFYLCEQPMFQFCFGLTAEI